MWLFDQDNFLTKQKMESSIELPTKERFCIILEKYNKKEVKQYIESKWYMTFHDMENWNLWESESHPYLFLDYSECDNYYRYSFWNQRNEEHWKELNLN